MKKIIISLAILGFSFLVNAQSSSDVGKIALSVVMPDNIEGMDVSQISKLQTKITQILTVTGLGASGYNNNFVIYPKFSIIETNVVESGMQDITIINCDLTLFIKQVDNNVVFSTINKTIKGNGKSRSLAISNALTKVNTNDADYQQFINTGKNKIIQYYEAMCQGIITKSDGLAKRQDYEQALGLLMTVPEEVSCYNKIQQKSIEIYKAYQNQRCNVQLQQAKTEIASNNFSSGLNILSQIDPSTPCYKESQALINKAADKVAIEEKRNWELKMKIYNDSVALEKERINAVKEIAVAYYQSRPTTVSYNLLIVN
jgi:hypothetical protein